MTTPSIFGRIKSRNPVASENGKGPAGQKGVKPRPLRISKTKEPFAIVPESHFILLAQCKSSAVFPIYVMLYLTWCERLQKQNPVNLNTKKLIALGYSPSTIYRALEEMEAIGLVQAARKRGKRRGCF
jgi:hypothetical protein